MLCGTEDMYILYGTEAMAMLCGMEAMAMFCVAPKIMYILYGTEDMYILYGTEDMYILYGTEDMYRLYGTEDMYICGLMLVIETLSSHCLPFVLYVSDLTGVLSVSGHFGHNLKCFDRQLQRVSSVRPSYNVSL